MPKQTCCLKQCTLVMVYQHAMPTQHQCPAQQACRASSGRCPLKHPIAILSNKCMLQPP